MSDSRAKLLDGGLLIRLTLSLAVLGLIVWTVALILALPAASVSGIVIFRTILAVLMLVVVTRFFVRRADAGPAVTPTVALSAVLSYFLSPPSWNGRMLFGQLVVEPGVASMLVDLVVWVAVVIAIGRLTPAKEKVERSPYQSVAPSDY